MTSSYRSALRKAMSSEIQRHVGPLQKSAHLPNLEDVRALRISAKIIVRRLDGRMAFVPKGPAVWTFSCASSKRPTGEQKTAQGFSPGNDTHKEIALKGRPNGIEYNVYICCV